MRSRSPASMVTALVLTGLIIGALSMCVVFGPMWIVGDKPSLTAAERLKAQNDVRSTLLQGFGGFLALGGVALGAIMTLRQVRANREGHSIDLFTKAIEMLASDQVSVRQGGVYALEQLAELDDRYHGHTHALLTALIRQHAPWPPNYSETHLTTTARAMHAGMAEDVGAALGVLGRQSMILGGAWSELERVDLRNAELDKLDIPRLCLAHSNLEGASLVDVSLTGATLRDTVLRNAILTRADLRGADLTDADLTGAHLDGTILLGANLTGAQLHDTDLHGVVADHTTTWPLGITPPNPEYEGQ